MPDALSGTYLQASSAVAKADRLALAAYELGNLRPDGEEGTGELTRRLFGPAGIAISERVPPRRAIVEFYCWRTRDRSYPRCVRMARGQRPEDLVQACSMACAQYIAWAKGETLDAEAMELVAHAIALPTMCLQRAEDEAWTVEEIAEYYVLDANFVHERLRVLRVHHGSADSTGAIVASAAR